MFLIHRRGRNYGNLCGHGVGTGRICPYTMTTQILSKFIKWMIFIAISIDNFYFYMLLSFCDSNKYQVNGKKYQLQVRILEEAA